MNLTNEQLEYLRQLAMTVFDCDCDDLTRQMAATALAAEIKVRTTREAIRRACVVKPTQSAGKA